ncbi:substrate-binding periplasmic protein [Thalassotalea euphylliae]|uniref:substrate-binding periplasmic protein n=1 Tax=Thalassotalea euphylliae TaxID=1655234 RepID=UPI0036428491
MFTRWLAVLLACSWFSFTTSAAQPHIRFVTEHLPPYQIADSRGGVSGFATEIVEAAAKHAKIDYSFTAYPWMQAYEIAQKAPNTCIFSIARTPVREALFHWVAPIVETNSSFFGLASSSIKQIQTIEEAKNYKVAVLRDDASHQVLLDNGFEEDVNLYIVDNTQSLLKLLAHREGIDLIVSDIMTIRHRAIYDKIDPNIFKQFLTLHDKPLSYYLACHQETNAETIDVLNHVIMRMKQSGEAEQIINDWLESLISSE